MRILALTCAMLVLATSGCGGGAEETQGASPEEWVADVCGAVTNWVGTEKQLSNEFDQAVQNAPSIPAVRDSFLEFVDETIAATDEMLTSLEAAGSPAVEDGAAIARDLRAALAKLQAAFREGRTQAAALPDDVQAFTQGMDDIGASFDAASEQVTEAIGVMDKYEASELQDAADKEPACQELHAATS